MLLVLDVIEEFSQILLDTLIHSVIQLFLH